MVASRRSRRMRGVGRTSPKPSGRRGRTRSPSHDGLRVTHLFATVTGWEGVGSGECVEPGSGEWVERGSGECVERARGVDVSAIRGWSVGAVWVGALAALQDAAIKANSVAVPIATLHGGFIWIQARPESDGSFGSGTPAWLGPRLRPK
jgi:hypothetical protein